MSYSETQRDRIEKTPIYRELDYRKNDGLEVILMWLKKTNTVWINLIDTKDERDLTFQVPNEEALLAFRHPYAYAAFLGKLASKELAVYEDGA